MVCRQATLAHKIADVCSLDKGSVEDNEDKHTVSCTTDCLFQVHIFWEICQLLFMYLLDFQVLIEAC